MEKPFSRGNPTGWKSLTRGRARDQRHDKAWMNRPDWWDYWPFLQVKRGRQLATATMFARKHNTVWLSTNLTCLEGVRRLTYASLNDLLADGWKVDWKKLDYETKTKRKGQNQIPAPQL